MKKYFIISLIFVATVFLPFKIQAAKFSTYPPELTVGQPATVNLSIDTEGQNVNAIELSLTYLAEYFTINSVSNGNSVVNFWVQQPNFSNGEISLSGIVAGGYTGSQGKLITISLTPKKEGNAEFSVKSAEVLLNDGQGTQAKVQNNYLKFSISKTGPSQPPPQQTGQPQVQPETKDISEPESFVLEVAKDENIFNGKYFLSFATQDKGSGIDYYLVQEKRVYKIFGFQMDRGGWKKAESPYLLSDQQLKSIISVKAVDKAGNERIEILQAQKALAWYENYLIWAVVVIAVLIILCIIFGIKSVSSRSL